MLDYRSVQRPGGVFFVLPPPFCVRCGKKSRCRKDHFDTLVCGADLSDVDLRPVPSNEQKMAEKI